MEDTKELYILGNSIETPVGTMKFLKVNQYPTLCKYLPYLNLEKFEVMNMVNRHNSEFASIIGDMEFIEVIKTLDILGLRTFYEELFLLCFGKNIIDEITSDEEFESYRTKIREINCISYDKKNPNPEIERFNQMKRAFERKKNGDVSFESVVTSVWVSLGESPKNLTMYQLYSLFSRIGQFKNYDTMTLYNSASGTIDVEGWYKHIDMNKMEEKTSLDEFSSNAKSLIE